MNASRASLLRRPLTWVVAGVAVIVLALGAFFIGTRIYAAQQNASAAEAYTASTTSAAEASAGDIAGSWSIADGSEAGYRVEEVLNGQDVTVVGRTEDTSGSITIDGTTLTQGEITVDLTTVATDENARDEYFRSTAVDTGTYPEATFALDGDVDLAALAADGTQTATVAGTLEINGQTQGVQIELTLTRTAEGTLEVVGSSDVTWADYGVEAPSLGFVTVEDAGQIEFSLVLEQS
ncbi:YceI family protein [Brachybacterium sp. DNPG3]